MTPASVREWGGKSKNNITHLETTQLSHKSLANDNYFSRLTTIKIPEFFGD